VNPFRFATKYLDDETDLTYFGYRYYGTSVGRWLSRDPINEEGGVNLFGFGNNDTLSSVDALGLSFKVISEQAKPGTIDPTHPRIYGRTKVTLFNGLHFTVNSESVTCAHCATIKVISDYEVEVTSITPTEAPPQYTDNGFKMIVHHESERVDVYRTAYDGYLAKVKDLLDGKYLCCSHIINTEGLYAWGLKVRSLYEQAWEKFNRDEELNLNLEYLPRNVIQIPVNGVLMYDGTRYKYMMGTPATLQLPAFPGCGSDSTF